jgi:hypothetical protein
VRPELLVRAQVAALAEQVHVEIRQHAPEVVGVAALHGDPAGEVRNDAVVQIGPRGRARHHRLEHAARVGALHRDIARRGMHDAEGHLARGGLKDTDDQRIA